MAQKPMLRGEVGARALRVRSDVRGHGQVRLCKALGCGRCDAESIYKPEETMGNYGLRGMYTPKSGFYEGH